ncbi:MAG: ABC transporter permease [Chloroflexota bacterium]|nr:ABC transporter permease [Chloroflexota bacterium]
MSAYVARRLALAVPTLLGLIVLAFTLIVVAPGDPAAELARRRAPSGEATEEDVTRARIELRLDRPYPEQLVEWVAHAATGDLGTSFSTRRPVTEELAARLPVTAELGAAALALTVVVAVPLGALAAVRHRSLLDHGLRVVSLLGASIPGFFLAYLLVVVFATMLHLLPVAGRQSWTGIVLPAITLAVGPAAVLARLVRATLLEVLGEDFVRAARSRGFSEVRVVVGHALPNALIPILTVTGSLVGHLLAGAVIVETIFAWPGIGKLAVDAIFQRDYTMLQGVVLFVGGVFVLVNLAVDLSYAFVDPRIRIAGR